MRATTTYVGSNHPRWLLLTHVGSHSPENAVCGLRGNADVTGEADEECGHRLQVEGVSGGGEGESLQHGAHTLQQ